METHDESKDGIQRVQGLAFGLRFATERLEVAQRERSEPS
jgi:hypothetical protein